MTSGPFFNFLRLWGSAGSAILIAPIVLATPSVNDAAAKQGSLTHKPQDGSTPRQLPMPPASSRIRAPIGERQEIRAPIKMPSSLVRRYSGTVMTMRMRSQGLPEPLKDPLALDPADDPVLQLVRAAVPVDSFHQVIAAAVNRNPALDESFAQRDEAEAARNEQEARLYPMVDVTLTGYKTLSRAFSNDFGNVLERSRPRERTDATVRVQQVLFDFGASRARIAAGNDRLLAAKAGIEDTSAQIALRAIGAWYSVYGYRTLVSLAEAFTESQREFHFLMEQRVAQGAAARGDVVQVDSYIASSQAQLADLRRSLASAEAQFTAVVGTPPPLEIGRAPSADTSAIQQRILATDVASMPSVRGAKAVAQAATTDAVAARADLAPQITAGLEAGRYGVLENRRDYDVRANLTLAMRLGGGGKQRADQARARARAADARYRRTEVEAQRDARIALSDVAALEDATHAIETNYIASRRSRDILVERFRVSRGTLFDVLNAESNYFGVAARYIQTVTELDTSRYILLARTGRLLSTLAIASDAETVERKPAP